MPRPLPSLALAVLLVLSACSGGNGLPGESAPGFMEDPGAGESDGLPDAPGDGPLEGSSPPSGATPAETPPASTEAGLPVRPGDLRADLSGRTLPGRGSNAFSEPGAGDLSAFEAAFTRLLREGATAEVRAEVERLGFALSLSRGAGTEYLVLEDTVQKRSGGTFVVNLSPARDLILEAPHSDSDEGTGGQTAAMFLQLGARALLLNGAHRCASASLSTCAPENTFCGKGGRISDAAQHPFSFFTSAHRALRAAFPQALAASVHGMDTDADEAAVISDGTRFFRPGSVANRLRDSLNGQLTGGAARGFSCNDTADDGKFRPLCGTTNAQGTLDNTVADACHGEATASSDRFLHIEQSATLRLEHQGSTGPDALTRAFAGAVTCALGGPGLSCPGS